MASEAMSGVGTKFRKWTAGNWVDIAEVNSITGPSMTRDTIDVTSLDSIGGYREFIAGFRNPGTISLSMNFTNVSYTIMKTDYEDENPQSYDLLLPDLTSLEFIGLVTELPLTVPADDKITIDVVIQISGPVSLESGSGSS